MRGSQLPTSSINSGKCRWRSNIRHVCEILKNTPSPLIAQCPPVETRKSRQPHLPPRCLMPTKSIRKPSSLEAFFSRTKSSRSLVTTFARASTDFLIFQKAGDRKSRMPSLAKSPKNKCPPRSMRARLPSVPSGRLRHRQKRSSKKFAGIWAVTAEDGQRLV